MWIQEKTQPLSDGRVEECHKSYEKKRTLAVVSGRRIPPADLDGGTIFSTNTLSNNGINRLATVTVDIVFVNFEVQTPPIAIVAY